MGIFKKFGDAVASIAGGKAARGFQETFVNPVAREFIRPFVTTRAGIDGLVKGGRTGQESVETPFGEVKPLGNLQTQAKGTSLEDQNALRGGQAAGGAAELALTVPGLATKVAGKLAKPFLKTKVAQKVAGAFRGSAERTLSQALAPTTNRLKEATKKIVPEMLDRGMSGTLKGLKKKALSGLQKAGTALDEFGELEGTTAVEKVTSAMQSAKEGFIVNKVAVNKGAVAAIDELTEVLTSVADDTGQIGREHLRAVRRIWDEAVQKAGGYHGKSLKEGSELDVMKTGANAIRNLLAEEVPDLAKINKEYNFYSNLLDVVEATKTRKVGQSGLVRRVFGAGLGMGLGKAASALTGIPGGEFAGAAAGNELAKVTGSTLFKSLSAKGKNLVADAITQGGKSLPKIASFFAKATYPTLKLKDLGNFLDNEANMDDEEAQAAEEAHEARIEELRAKLKGGATEVSDEDREARIQTIRDRLLQSKTTE